jgi:hypothetical protein
MSTPKPTYATALASLQALIAGTQKHTPNGTFLLANATYTTAQLVQIMQTMINLLTARTAATASAKEAVLAVKNADAQYNSLLATYRAYLRTTYGKAAQTLADYDLAPTKTRKPLDAKAMMAKAEQNNATRVARSTVGPKKKASIKGVVVKPVQATAAPDVQPSAALPPPPAKPAS